MSTVGEELLEALENLECNDVYLKYNNEGEDLGSIISSFLLEAEKENKVEQWSVCEDTCFDSPGYEVGFVVAAWVEKGKLYTEQFLWEI